MRRVVKSLIASGILVAVAATPLLAATVTRTFPIGRRVVTCTITYEEANGNSAIDSLAELRSISAIACTIS